MIETKALSLRKAAHLLGISVDTARRAVKAGKLRAFRMRERGHYRLRLEELERFMKENDYVG